MALDIRSDTRTRRPSPVAPAGRQPLRIAMIAACPFPWPRGTPIRIHRMAEALGKRGHDVHVITYHLGDATPTPYMRVHRITGPSWYSRVTPGPSMVKLALLDPLLTYKLRQLLHRHRFDVIHAHHYEGLITALWARNGTATPIIFDAHTLLEAELPAYGMSGVAWAKRSMGRVMDHKLPPRADHVITVSDEIRDQLELSGTVRASRLSSIANGVEVEHFAGVQAPAQGGNVLLFAGNLAPYQRVDLLLEAFASLRKMHDCARLQILTDGDFTPFVPMCNRLGITEHVQVVDVDYQSLPRWLQRATVLANPRVLCSGVPQKLLNYMASGTPVVSFAGSAKFLRHEESGLIVPDSDVQAFARAALRLMRDPTLAAQIGQRAQLAVTEEHSWGQVAARVEAVYAKVARRGALANAATPSVGTVQRQIQ